MKIESVSFGQVLIDGKKYTKDLVIFSGEIRENWWRKDGHSLVVEDLPEIFASPPAQFVVGCGQNNVLTVPEKTRRAFHDAGIDLIELDTPAACKKLNQLFAEGADAAGGLHLTC